MIEENVDPSCSRLTRFATGVFALKKASQLVVICCWSAAVDEEPDVEDADGLAAGDDVDDAGGFELLLLLHAARPRPTMHASRIEEINLRVITQTFSSFLLTVAMLMLTLTSARWHDPAPAALFCHDGSGRTEIVVIFDLARDNDAAISYNDSSGMSDISDLSTFARALGRFMEELDLGVARSTASKTYIPAGTYVLRPGNLAAALLSVCTAQMAMATPAALNGLLQQDLGTSSAQLTWISDAFLIPVCILELSFGVLGDLFGRKRLLVGGALVIALGQAMSVLIPGSSLPSGARVPVLPVLWASLAIVGIGAAAIFPTSLAMITAGTHTAADRVRSVCLWAAVLSAGNGATPVLGSLAAKLPFGSDPYAGWRWAFLLIMALALVSALVSRVSAADSSSPEGRSLDWWGQVTISVALFALMYAVVQGPTSGWRSWNITGGFAVGGIFLMLFILVERRSAAPLLRLDFFRNRNLAVTSVVTVIGMFAFLGIADSTSIRLSAIEGFSPIETAMAFLCFNGMAVILLPVTIRLLRQHSPKWSLSGGLMLMACGALWVAARPTTDQSLAPVIPAFLLVGLGFALALSALSVIAVSTPPTHLAGMSSGTTSMLRDLGFTLGPAVIGAVALSQATAQIRQRLAASPALRHALSAFVSSPARAPAAHRRALQAAVHAVQSGPLGANAIPATRTLPGGQIVPFNPLKQVAYDALSRAYSLGFIISGAAALLAALITLIAIRDQADDMQLELELLDE
jgi:MFS family permease